MDLSLERIAAANDRIHPAFLDTPQFVDERLSAELGREVVVKVETLNPIGSFKGRGTWLLAQGLDRERTWVCATAGNFGQGLAYAARANGAGVHVFASAGAPPEKVERMRALGARVEISERSEEAARDRTHPLACSPAPPSGCPQATSQPEPQRADTDRAPGREVVGRERWRR